MTEPLTLDWIISTLKKSGINSKQVVIDRLEKASSDELLDLAKNIAYNAGRIHKNAPFYSKVEMNILDPRD